MLVVAVAFGAMTLLERLIFQPGSAGRHNDTPDVGGEWYWKAWRGFRERMAPRRAEATRQAAS